MYLKQIEMSGFKSFADRTLISFGQGVTSVVGPNGCGKSNILDALRWVLGEQRPRELRGGSMQDVIFNGSENRHALGMAEVSITFDNSDSVLPIDFSEVQVTRRLYRSGESEYLINKAPCRLRDIQELFMDTGIGTNAYSMIGQGKMDMLLSSKPEDRRFVFEEAAGIIKYKNRKKLAMRRLEGAEQNLLRLNDIILEVERQMRTLKRQVNAAIRYRELSDELKVLEIRAAWLEYTRLRTEIADLKVQFAAASDSYTTMSTEISSLEARQEEINLSRLETERVRLARQQGVYEIDSEMEKIERQIALLRQRIDHSKEKEHQAEREQGSFSDRAAELRNLIEQATARAEAVKNDIESCRQSLDAKLSDHAGLAARVEDADRTLEALRQRASERVEARAQTQTALETINVTISNIDSQLEEIYRQQQSVAGRREEVLGALDSLRGSEAEKQDALRQTESQRRDAAKHRSDQEEALRALDESWQSAREQKSSLEARLRSLRELRDSYEGFAAGVRAVMLASKKKMAGLDGIIGPVGDLLSPEKDYERAIEAALGGNVNNVVVEHADAAKTAINFLKQNSAGRVTFLPLDTIRGSEFEGGQFPNEKGVIGPAIDFVKYEKLLHNAVTYLLHGTLVVETLDDAIRITRNHRRHPRLVTLDGEVVSPSGAVTGGRMKHESRGLLGRTAEITELEEKVRGLETQLQDLAQKRTATSKAINELQETLRVLEQQDRDLRKLLNELGMTIARNSAEMESLVKTSQDLDRQRDALMTRRGGLEEQRKDASAKADSLQTDDEMLQSQIAAAQEAAAHARQAMSQCTSEVSDLRVSQAELAQRFEEAERDRARETQRLAEMQSEAGQRRDLVAMLKEEQAELSEEIALNIERSKALSETKEEASLKAVEAQNQLQTLLDEGERIDKSLRELRDKSRSAQADVHRLELQLRQDEDRVEFHNARILQDYEIALASVTEELAGGDDMDEKTRNKRVADLRQQLHRMGEVNLMAIEEYEALEQRYAFLTTQAADLSQARDALMAVIERSDKRIREMFLETFKRIGDHFRENFRRLFNGGQATIYLLDENDPLETGIEIEARPPGKKPQSISLLSGGESAMTAIALLFSVFMARPSPFCVLDEVDAPLDDANIGRFLKLLDEFTGKSQFVVITHNKQTMARADVLYGVTQQERGVSTIVSVKFTEDAA
ncbi:MAG: chromosome partition protein Smc [Candidatus Hydrogenedentota bacterium]